MAEQEGLEGPSVPVSAAGGSNAFAPNMYQPGLRTVVDDGAGMPQPAMPLTSPGGSFTAGPIYQPMYYNYTAGHPDTRRPPAQLDDLRTLFLTGLHKFTSCMHYLRM